MPLHSSSLSKSEWSAAEPSPISKLELSLTTAAHFARRHAIAAIYRAGIGDVGSALSAADLLACLYGAELNLWPSTIADPDRDRFVLSNGDATPTLYAIAAHYGFCDANEALDFCKFGSRFQIYPHDASLSFVELNSGLVGEGFSAALGMALGLKMQQSRARVYALLGQNEAQAGQVWETAICAANQGLDNFCAIVEVNKPAHDDAAAIRCWPEPMAARWRAFEWAVAEVDGHNLMQLLSVFRRAATVQNRPTLIVAYTERGKGVPALRHAQAGAPLSVKQAAEALAALGMSHNEITELLHDG